MEKKYVKLTIIFCSIILFITVGYYYQRNYQGEHEKSSFKEITTYAGVEWPAGSFYTVSEEGDITIELEQTFTAFKGVWPVGTKFYLDGNDLSKIEVQDDFEFAQLKFKHSASIEVAYFSPNLRHRMTLDHEIIIDGLEIKADCNIAFKNYTLYTATCPEFGTVYFKRFIELPEVINN